MMGVKREKSSLLTTNWSVSAITGMMLRAGLVPWGGSEVPFPGSLSPTFLIHCMGIQYM